MRRIPFIQADIFTEVTFEGNPVAVFPDADDLNREEMAHIAREMGSMESVFVQAPKDPTADVRLRFYTPDREVPFGGHASIGAHVVLHSLGRYKITGPVTRVWQQTRVGTLPADLITDGDGHTDRVVMTQDEARHGDMIDDADALASALGIEPDDILHELPSQVFSTGLPGLIVPLASLDAIQRIALNTPALNAVCHSVGAMALCAFTTETVDKAYHIHARTFAPAIGIMEDPGTGSLAGGLGAYVLQKGILPYEPQASTNHMVIEQGHEMGRPCVIEVEVDIRQGHVAEVRVSGQVVIVMQGELFLD